MRENTAQGQWTLRVHSRGEELFDFAPAGARSLGLAVDLGTSNVAGFLLDLESGARIASLGIENPQAAWGADLIGRINHAIAGPQAAAELRTAAVTAILTTILFLPALLTRSVVTAVPYLLVAVLMLSAQNPPLDAARLDIMPPLLWGRAEAIRTLLRSLAMALAPLLFGAVSDHVFGGGRSGLQWTFVVMLVPLAASAWLLFKARRTYPRDVATAAAVGAHSTASRASERN